MTYPVPKRPIKIWYDCEFWERGVLDYPIDLISIGMTDDVRADLYLQNVDADFDAIATNPWLKANVLANLKGFDMATLRPERDPIAGLDESVWATRKQIANAVRGYILAHAEAYPGDKVQLRAWYGDYDHTILAGLFGRMIDLPEGVPMWTYDIKQKVFEIEQHIGTEINLPDQPKGEHNALADAYWNREIDLFLDCIISPKLAFT